jgi:transposase
MEYGAIDLHLKTSLIRIVDADGVVVSDRRVGTTRAALTQVFGGRAPLRVLLESGTESAWVAHTVEACGHEVIVADPNYALMYGQRTRCIKTDKRDVAALAEACRLGIYRVAHRVSAEQRAVRRMVRIREQLVRVRTQTINLLRAQLRQEGVRLPAGSAESVVARRAALELPAALREALAPLRELLTAVAPLIAGGDAQVAVQAAADPVVCRLRTVPGIGPGDYQSRPPGTAGVAGPSRLGGVAPTPRARGVARVGRAPGGPSRPPHRRRRAGAPVGAHSLRDLAG